LTFINYSFNNPRQISFGKSNYLSHIKINIQSKQKTPPVLEMGLVWNFFILYNLGYKLVSAQVCNFH
jgi:hypothetical protein